MLCGFRVESVSFKRSFLWNTLDDSIKQEPTLACFKNKMKTEQVDSARVEYSSNIVFDSTNLTLISVFLFHFVVIITLSFRYLCL